MEPVGDLSGAISIVLVDDHAVVRAGLRMLLDREDDLVVAGEAAETQSAIDVTRRAQPQVVVLDINLRGISSLGLIPELKAAGANVVMLTMQGEPTMVRAAFRLGASAYVVKDAADVELVEAVRLAARGLTWVSPQVGGRLAEPEVDDPLSPREAEVLTLIGLGYTNREIADRLVLSVRTVESHRRRIQEKLGVSSRKELVEEAMKRRLLGG